MSESNLLGERIAELRNDLGLTKASLSRKTGVTQHTIIKLENGTVKNPSYLVMMRLSEIFNVSMDSWVNIMEQMHPKE